MLPQHSGAPKRAPAVAIATTLGYVRRMSRRKIAFVAAGHPEAREALARLEARYYVKDLADWTRLAGLRIGQPPVFPVNSVRAMRACLVAEEQGRLIPWVRAVFETYWGDLQDISQPGVLAGIATRVGLDPEKLLAAIETQPYKDRLRANTDELIARGGFGSPTMFVGGDDMYFGNDRLELVRAALERR